MSNTPIENAPLLTPLMDMLADYHVEENGYHYRLSDEVVEEIRHTLEKYVKDGFIYLAPHKG